MQLGQTEAIWISPFCMGLLCTVSCLASLALPDTRGKPLLLDLKAAEVFYSKEQNALYGGLCRNKVASED